MPSGAVHPNSGNFSRGLRLNVVSRVRRLVETKAYEKRPDWLTFAERAPPMELSNLKLRDVRIKSPYPAMIKFVLSKYPDMRFQDCFVDGNDWSKGNDTYRDDHPVMQFVARQLQLINSGMSRQSAFAQVESEYLARRHEIEKRQKIEMALACNSRIVPAFASPQSPNPLHTTGAGIARQREAQIEFAHLNHIRRKLRMLRKEIEPHDKKRMNAKELALDVEIERYGLLPKMTSSRYPAAVVSDTAVNTQAVSCRTSGDRIKSDTASPDEYNLSNSEEAVYWEDSNAVPTEMAELSPSSPSPNQFYLEKEEGEEFHFPDFNMGDPGLIDSTDDDLWKSGVIAETPTSNFTNPQTPANTSRPRWSLGRPDKVTVQSILAKKKSEEIKKRLGKEPGDQEDPEVDFEDFMSMMKSRK